MKTRRTHSKKIAKLLVGMSLLAVVASPFGTLPAHAGKQGVFVNGDIYFALDDVTLTPGASDQTIRFGVELVNGSQSSIDYNGYGIRLIDSNGNSYSAQLTEKTQAVVGAGKTAVYNFMSQIPSGITADQLKVDVFAWDFGSDTFMRDLGKLDVSAVPVKQSEKGQVILNLHDVNDALPSDALVSFGLQSSYKALSNGSWYQYADIVAENLSSSSFKLPNELTFDVKDGAGLTYAVSAVTGSDKTLLPHQKTMLVVQIPLGDAASAAGLALELLQKAASSSGTQGSSGTNGSGGTGSNTGGSSAATTASSDPVVLGSINLAASKGASAVGETAAYPSAGANALSMVTERFSVVPMSEGTQVTGIFTLKNETDSLLPIPNLTAGYQLSQSTLSAAAADNAAGSHPAYLSKGESTTFSFTGTLPKGVDTSAIQLVVWEKVTSGTTTTTLPVHVAQVSSKTSSTGTDGVYTSIGRLSFQLKSTYRLLTDSGDDVLMSEIQVFNNDSKIVSLPAASALYGGLHMGSFDVPGSATYLQTSPMLNPGQTTTIYMYSKIPYTTQLTSGYIYLGATNAQTTPATKTEWVELPYSAQVSAPAPAALNNEWMINDAGRTSTGKIVESKVYDVGSQKMLAVRILQTNKTTRNGTVVPYNGYSTDTKGNVWSLNTTEETGKLGNDGQALSTIWTVLPNGATADGWSTVFGQKVADGVFADPQTYAFAQTGDSASSQYGSQIYQASLFPYSVTMTNGKIQFNNVNKYDVSFDFTQTSQGSVAGASKNRSLQLVLLDNAGNAVATVGEYALEKPTTGNSTLSTLTTGSNNKITVTIPSTTDLNALIQGPRLAVYEKFEGGTRLVGTLTLSLY